MFNSFFDYGTLHKLYYLQRDNCFTSGRRKYQSQTQHSVGTHKEAAELLNLFVRPERSFTVFFRYAVEITRLVFYHPPQDRSKVREGGSVPTLLYAKLLDPARSFRCWRRERNKMLKTLNFIHSNNFNKIDVLIYWITAVPTNGIFYRDVD